MRNAPRRADAGRHAPAATRIPDVRHPDAAAHAALADDLALRLRDLRAALPPPGFDALVRQLARARRRLDARTRLTA